MEIEDKNELEEIWWGINLGVTRNNLRARLRKNIEEEEHPPLSKRIEIKDSSNIFGLRIHLPSCISAIQLWVVKLLLVARIYNEAFNSLI